MPGELADIAAEIETLRLADVEARRQYAAYQRDIRNLADLSDGLLIAIAGRRDTTDQLLDEWLALRAAETVAEALVDERPRAMPGGRMA